MAPRGRVRHIARLRDDRRPRRRNRRALRPARRHGPAQLHKCRQAAARVLDELLRLDFIRDGALRRRAALEVARARKDARAPREQREPHALAKDGKRHLPEEAVRERRRPPARARRAREHLAA